uniref:Uncharacterized protein n=1 Tax=Kalanchoe fedtschenkoi TaxID=63787 RepID=A0A7N0TQV1_KALFE
MAAIRLACHLVKYRNLLTRRAYFCTASAPRSRRCFFPDEEEGESAVYTHAMKFQRPSVMKWSERLAKLENLVSLIGSVYWPIKVYETKHGPVGPRFGATTLLDVKTPHDSSSSFRIRLQMWDDMARMCSQHLKPKDFIYVSGQLERFVDRNDVKQCKLIVKELNYVTKPSERLATPTCDHSELEGIHFHMLRSSSKSVFVG